MAIRLDIIKPTTQVEEARKAGYLYKDISFDLKNDSTPGRELFRSNVNTDLKSLYDAASVLNSLKNILTTSPGEKLLNPDFGLDLRDYLFEIITETKAFFLGQRIYNGLTVQESRVVIDFIDILINPEQSEYIIDISLSIPSLDVFNISLKGILNNEGFTFT
jgi:phage baseplate assembly protein W